MPIILNIYLNFSNGRFHYQILSNWRFQWSKNVNVFYWFRMKIILQICNKISHTTGTFFLCAVLYVNHMLDHSLLCSSRMYNIDRQDENEGDTNEGSNEGKRRAGKIPWKIYDPPEPYVLYV